MRPESIFNSKEFRIKRKNLDEIVSETKQAIDSSTRGELNEALINFDFLDKTSSSPANKDRIVERQKKDEPFDINFSNTFAIFIDFYKIFEEALLWDANTVDVNFLLIFVISFCTKCILKILFDFIFDVFFSIFCSKTNFCWVVLTFFYSLWQKSCQLTNNII